MAMISMPIIAGMASFQRTIGLSFSPFIKALSSPVILYLLFSVICLLIQCIYLVYLYLFSSLFSYKSCLYSTRYDLISFRPRRSFSTSPLFSQSHLAGKAHISKKELFHQGRYTTKRGPFYSPLFTGENTLRDSIFTKGIDCLTGGWNSPILAELEKFIATDFTLPLKIIELGLEKEYRLIGLSSPGDVYLNRYNTIDSIPKRGSCEFLFYVYHNIRSD